MAKSREEIYARLGVAAERARSDAAEINAIWGRSLDGWIKIGEILKRQREKLGCHYRHWLKVEFPFSETQARSYVGIADFMKGRDVAKFAKVGFAVMVELASHRLPPEVESRLIQRVEAGEAATFSEMQQLRKEKRAASRASAQGKCGAESSIARASKTDPIEATAAAPLKSTSLGNFPRSTSTDQADEGDPPSELIRRRDEILAAIFGSKFLENAIFEELRRRRDGAKPSVESPEGVT